MFVHKKYKLPDHKLGRLSKMFKEWIRLVYPDHIDMETDCVDRNATSSSGDGFIGGIGEEGCSEVFPERGCVSVDDNHPSAKRARRDLDDI